MMCNVSLLKPISKKAFEKEKKSFITIGQYLQNFWNKETDYAQQTFVCPLIM
jgi:hypothetical protein